MKTIQIVKRVVQRQILASIPGKHRRSFAAHLFNVNMTRFITQCVIMVLMDTISLLYYAFNGFLRGGMYPLHLIIHGTKIALALGATPFLSARMNKGYNENAFLDRNIEILYPSLHFVMEFFLFSTGPQQLGALLRFAAVPFVIGGIPVIRQKRSLVLQLTIFTGSYLFLRYFSAYTQFGQTFALPLSIATVVLPCAIMISFTVYSWFVNTFMATLRANETAVELGALNEKLREISCHDPLTGLLNRRGFQQRMRSAWEMQPQDGATASVIMIDIDFFKLFNDKFGHMLGDECLVRVTKVLAEARGDDDIILGRYGGEEFIIAAFNRTHEYMVTLSNELRAKIYALRIDNPDSNVAPYVTISVGIATCILSQACYYDELVNAADEALYIAKRSGRNQVIHTRDGATRFHDLYGAMIPLPQSGSYDSVLYDRAFHDISVDCTFIYDGVQDILRFSEEAAAIYDVPRSIVGPTLKKIIESVPVINVDKRVFINALGRCIEEKNPFFSMDIHLSLRDREHFLVSVRIHFEYKENGAIHTGYGMILRTEKLLQYCYYTNRHALTSITTLLPNRNKLIVDVREYLAEPGASGYLIMADIVRFREVNGIHGHAVGDRVLGAVALMLANAPTEELPIYHYGVDQFVIVAQQFDESKVKQMMQNVLTYFLQTPAIIDDLQLSIDLTIVSIAMDAASNLDDLLVDLDIALLVTKLQPDANAVIFSEKDRDLFLTRFYQNKEIAAAVEDGFKGFFLLYQPIVDIQKKCCIGAEALLRWRNKEGEVVPPDIAIPMLEQSGLMSLVEPWIFDTACKTCNEWIRNGASADFFININLSPVIISRESLHQEVMSAMMRYGLNPCNITLEVPESSAITEVRSTIETLEMLRRKGIRIAIDDFGTGYSSLNYLSTLPADEVKIDRSFVTDIEHNSTAEEFLGAVVGLAKSLNLVVCIEGVETSLQSELICQSNADYVQGYLYGKPVPSQEFMDILHANT